MERGTAAIRSKSHPLPRPTPTVTLCTGRHSFAPIASCVYLLSHSLCTLAKVRMDLVRRERLAVSIHAILTSNYTIRGRKTTWESHFQDWSPAEIMRELCIYSDTEIGELEVRER